MTALAKYRKLIVAAGGALALLATTGLLHGDAQRWVEYVLGVLTLWGVYRAPNAPAA